MIQASGSLGQMTIELEKLNRSWKNLVMTIPCEGKAKTESFGKTQNISSKIEKLPSATSHQYLNIASSDGHIPSSFSLHPMATDHIRCLYQGSRDNIFSCHFINPILARPDSRPRSPGLSDTAYCWLSAWIATSESRSPIIDRSLIFELPMIT